MTTVVEGVVTAPPSKSVTHRAYLLSAQSPRPATVVGPLRAADTDAMLACLHRLGFQARPEEGTVHFLPAHAVPPRGPLDCQNAGTALRLLAATCARFPFSVALDGDASLRSRPHTPLLAALRGLGARVHPTDRAPFTVHGPITPGTVRLAPGGSSQYASALLLSLPMLAGPSVVHLAPPVASRPYLDVTCAVARSYGLRIEGEGPFTVPGGDAPACDLYRVEGDWSSAAVLLAAAAVTKGRATVRGLRADSAQGDRAIVSHLVHFGAKVTSQDDAVTVAGDDLQSPGAVDIAATPDLFPALAVVAACARGTTTFTGGAGLRHKESDRIKAMADGLRALGVSARETLDGLVVMGGRLGGGTVTCHGDHRVHMALRVAALAAHGDVELDGADTVQVSYPSFHDDLARITGGAP